MDTEKPISKSKYSWVEFSYGGNKYRTAKVNPIGDKEVISHRGGITIQWLYYHRWVTKTICFTNEVNAALHALGID